MTLDKGHGSISEVNPRTTSSVSFTYKVTGDTLTMVTEAAEQFVMRWKLEGDHLVLTRDPSIGIAPTGTVIEPWTRQS